MQPDRHNLESAPHCPSGVLTRRDFIKGTLASAVIAAANPNLLRGASQTAVSTVPRAPVGIGLCQRYEYPMVRHALAKLFNEIGGVRPLVKNKHVTVKVNLVNTSEEDVNGVPLWLTVTVHPMVAMALGSLLADYGARQITFCDQLPFRSTDEEAFAGYGFKLAEFQSAMRDRARFANTRNRGPFRNYAWVKVPGGELASAWEVSRVYTDTDVLVSLSKLKSHVSCGVSGGMKNLFGIPPSSLYGDDLDREPSEDAIGYRNKVMHNCTRKPFTSAGSFNDKSVAGDHGFNVPRFVVDLNAAFPIGLALIDGISTIQTAEGWWNGSMVSITRPGLLVAGRNAVCTDSIATALMGFDPESPDRAWPFVNGSNCLALARRRGLGENRVSEIEVAGIDLARARFEYQPTYRRKAS